MEKICAGVDIGGTTIKIGIFTTLGQLLEKWEIPTRKGENGELIFSDSAASLKKAFARRQISLSAVEGIGMGLPGALSPEGYLERCVNVAMKDLYPAKEFGKYFPHIPVQGGNDANLAALGEMWKGGGEGFRDVVMLTLGTGVGGGVISNGKLITGYKGMAGEIGHMRVNLQETERCNCGNHGCLEQYASATGIVREMRKTLETEKGECVLRGKNEFSCKDVLDCAKGGDPLSLKTVKRCMGYLALAMHYTAHVADPEVFVIGGGVSRAGEFLLRMIQDMYVAGMPFASRKASVRLAILGNDAGIYGGARLVLP